MSEKSLRFITYDASSEDCGCALYSSCMQCPRDKCIEEEKKAIMSERLKKRARKMLKHQRQGKKIKQIQRIFEVSYRTATRWLAFAKAEENEQQKKGEIATDAKKPGNDRKQK